MPGDEFTIGNNDGEDVGVTKTIRNYFSEDQIPGVLSILYLSLVLVNHFSVQWVVVD